MRLQEARGAYGEVALFRHAGQIALAHHPAIVTQGEMHGIGAVDETEHALQQVIAVSATAGHVEEQIELGGGGKGLAHSPSQLSATRRISISSRLTLSLRG